MAKKVTTVRLDEDLRERLREHADDRGISEAELIRQAIVFFLGYLHAQRSQQSPENDERPGQGGRGEDRG